MYIRHALTDGPAWSCASIGETLMKVFCDEDAPPSSSDDALHAMLPDQSRSTALPALQGSKQNAAGTRTLSNGSPSMRTYLSTIRSCRWYRAMIRPNDWFWQSENLDATRMSGEARVGILGSHASELRDAFDADTTTTLISNAPVHRLLVLRTIVWTFQDIPCAAALLIMAASMWRVNLLWLRVQNRWSSITAARLAYSKLKNLSYSDWNHLASIPADAATKVLTETTKFLIDYNLRNPDTLRSWHHIIMLEFLEWLKDLPFVPMMLVISITGWRIPSIWQDFEDETLRRPKFDYNYGVYRAEIAKNFIFVLLDALFFALCLPCLLSWRSSTFRAYLHYRSLGFFSDSIDLNDYFPPSDSAPEAESSACFELLSTCCHRRSSYRIVGGRRVFDDASRAGGGAPNDVAVPDSDDEFDTVPTSLVWRRRLHSSARVGRSRFGSTDATDNRVDVAEITTAPYVFFWLHFLV
jgi:hypothetical protein